MPKRLDGTSHKEVSKCMLGVNVFRNLAFTVIFCSRFGFVLDGFVLQ